MHSVLMKSWRLGIKKAIVWTLPGSLHACLSRAIKHRWSYQPLRYWERTGRLWTVEHCRSHPLLGCWRESRIPETESQSYCIVARNTTVSLSLASAVIKTCNVWRFGAAVHRGFCFARNTLIQLQKCLANQIMTVVLATLTPFCRCWS
jgi:hypothetical protein